MRTTDGGATWQDVGPPGTAGLQFRDIEAFDANHAVILSIGEQPDRLPHLRDRTTAARPGTLALREPEPTAFYDCMTFFDRNGAAWRSRIHRTACTSA